MTRPLRIDFVSAQAPGARFGGWLALAVVVAAWVALVDRQQLLHDRLLKAEQRVESLRGGAQRSVVRQAAAVAPDTVQRVQRANEVIDQLAVPWDALLDSIEAAPLRGVTLQQLAPSPREQTLRLSGEAASLPVALDYVAQLSRQTLLTEVHLLGYDTLQREGATVVAFSVSARWKLR